MADYPIIFSGPMVCALLGGRKTMTRRLAWRWTNHGAPDADDLIRKPSPWQKVRPGDRLWVRENGNWRLAKSTLHGGHAGFLFYAADSERGKCEFFDDKNRPSIHMPRWASRLTLVVTATKIERLQDISDLDAIAEGIAEAYGFAGWWRDYEADPVPDRLATSVIQSPRDSFDSLWRSLHGPESWDANPEVVALSFTVARCNIDQIKDAA